LVVTGEFPVAQNRASLVERLVIDHSPSS
jgi:hypothetical protein